MGNICSAIGAGIPTGTIMPWPSEIPPKGWLICDGREVSRTTYARLFAVIGTRFGEGDGSTTFNLPDLRGRVPAGLHFTDGDFNTIGKCGGSKTHVLTLDEIPTHSHGGFTGAAGGHDHGAATGSAGAHDHDGITGVSGDHDHGGFTGSDGLHNHTASTASAGAHTHTVTLTIGSYDVGGLIYYGGDFQYNFTTSSSGAHTHSVTINSGGVHSHTISASGTHTHTITSAPAHAHNISSVSDHVHSILSQGNGQAHNNLQPYLVLNFIIKT